MRFVFLFSFLFICGTLCSQHWCGSEEIVLGQNDHYSEVSKRSITYINVVVHVLYTSEIDSVSDEQIFSQIEVLNEDFGTGNQNFGETPSVFRNLAADTEIRFCLAGIDPNGQESTGITRTKTNVSNIGSTAFFYETDNGGRDPWDNKKYINIWVADFGNSGIAGIGTAPGQAVPSQRDGVIMNYKFFGREDLPGSSFPHDEGRICVHEMGHYFGLAHIFGSLGTSCSDDDGIVDTPLQDGPNFGCPTFPKPDICTQGDGVMFMNFMDYTDDACMSMFTQGQKARMWDILDNDRSELLGNNTLCVVDIDPKEWNENWQIYPNPAIDILNLSDDEYSDNEDLKIYDVHARLCFWTKVHQERTTINIEHLNAGMYLVYYKNQMKKILISE